RRGDLVCACRDMYPIYRDLSNTDAAARSSRSRRGGARQRSWTLVGRRSGGTPPTTPRILDRMKVVLPDGKHLELPDGATGADAARAIGPKLAEQAVLVRSNGHVRDLRLP